MANQYVNKVIYGNDTLVDLTGDTAEAGDVLLGKSFHLKSGLQSSGTLDPALKPDIAPVEASATTSQAYAVGSYLYYNSTLFMVTSAIAQGGTIITSGAGQNVTDVTVGSRLTALNSDLSDLSTTVAGKINTSDIANNLTTATAGKVLDATQGKALKDEADKLFVLSATLNHFSGSGTTWTDNSSVVDARITSSTVAMVYFDNPSAASSAGVDGDTDTGKIVFTATSNPSSLTCTIVCKNA